MDVHHVLQYTMWYQPQISFVPEEAELVYRDSDVMISARFNVRIFMDDMYAKLSYCSPLGSVGGNSAQYF